MQDRDERLMRLAGETLRTPVTERENFLRSACSDDKDLYTEVSEIVEWEERMGGFMRDPLIGLIDLEGLDRPFKPGQLVADRFEVIREVGDGGMGVVYEAYDRKRQQRIAIKCAKLGYERLSPELKGALQVRHPNICLVNEIHTVQTDLGELDFLTMEFLDGETLLNRLSRGKLEPDEALDFARQICAGLAEAHRSGVLHRDLKPANIILSPRGKNQELRAVITDFGLAADQDGNTDLIGGTPSYMAPELKQNGKSSTASDVYALGVILCEMVTGHKPFPDAGVSNGDAPPVAPSKLAKHLPALWDDAILPCLAANPKKRPTAKQVLAVLDRPPWYGRPWVSRVAIAVLVLLAAGAFLWRPIYEYLRRPDINLVILPVQGAGDMQNLGNGILRDVSERLAQEPQGKLKFHVVSSPTVAQKNVTTPEQAKTHLHATHVLEVSMSRDNGDIALKAAIINTETSAHLRDYSEHFSESDMGDLSGGLAGLVSAALNLPRAAIPEMISPAAKAAYESGKNYLSQGDSNLDQAIAQFQEAARIDPHSPLPLAGLAEAYIAKRGVENSEMALNRAQQYVQAGQRLNPDSPQVLMASSSLNIINGQNSQARLDAERAIKLEPGNAEAWIRSGFANEQLHIPDQALESYRKAIELAPGYYKGYEYLGAFYYYSEANYTEAESFYKKAFNLAPDRPEGYANLGALFTAQGRYAEAEKIYRAALKVKETPENLNNLAATLDRQKRDADALPLYKLAARLEPSSEIYLINIGDTNRRLSHAKAANAAYKEGLALTTTHLLTNPSSGLTRAYRAYCLARLGKTTAAEFEIGEALGSGQSDQQVILQAVLTYEAMENRILALNAAAKASASIKKDIEHNPNLADFNQDSRFTR